MRTFAGLLAALALMAWLPPSAQAQRRGNGMVNTPYGQFSMGDMASAGGDPAMAQQLREQKMAMLYQQQAMKQQQLMMQQAAKQQKARQDYLKQHPEVAKAEFEAQAAARARTTTRARPKLLKPKATTTDAKATTPAATKAAGSLKARREVDDPAAK